MDLQAVVLAAGKGSRMLDLTADQQKCYLPLANMPMIWYSLHYLQEAGFQEVIVVIMDGETEDLKACKKSLTIKIDVVVIPPSEDFGTADSLRHVKDKISSDVLVVSSDIVTDFPLHKLLDVYRLHGASLTALLAPVPASMDEMSIPGPRSKQKYERDYIGIEKDTGRLMLLSSEADYEEHIPINKSMLRKHPQTQYRNDLLDAHMYVIKKWVIDYLPSDKNISTIKGELVPLLIKKQFSFKKNTSQINDAPVNSTKDGIESLAIEAEDEWNVRKMSTWNDHTGSVDNMYHGNNIRCYGYVMDEGFCMRANTLALFLEINKQIVSRWSDLPACGNQPLISPSAELKSRIQGSSCSSIGDATIIGDKTAVKNSVIGKGCKIGDKVKITNSVILNNVTIEEGCVIQSSIVSKNSTIGSNSELKDCIIGSGQKVAESSKRSHESVVDINKMMEI